jgi:exopolysaccharide biosynthesis protein
MKDFLINLFLILVTACVLAFGCFLFVLYSPFTHDLRDLYICTAMKTYRHQYLATVFFPDQVIKDVLKEYEVQDDLQSSQTVEENMTLEEQEKLRSQEAENLKRYGQDLQDELMIDENGIKIYKLTKNLMTAYIMEIKDPKRVNLRMTSQLGVTGERIRVIAKRTGDIAGINASGFYDPDQRSNGGQPTGIVIADGKIMYLEGNDLGKKHAIIAFNDQHEMILGKYTLGEIKQQKIKDAVSFRPFIIINGEPLIKKGDGGWGLAPRTAIGQKKTGEVVMLVIDGRQAHSVGGTLKDIQEIMLKYSCYQAAMVDGGASSVMMYKDQIINSPSYKKLDRKLPNAFMVAQ